MRLVIHDQANQVADWAARYVLKRIKDFNPGPEKFFVLGLPTGRCIKINFKNILISFVNIISSFHINRLLFRKLNKSMTWLRAIAKSCAFGKALPSNPGK